MSPMSLDIHIGLLGTKDPIEGHEAFALLQVAAEGCEVSIGRLKPWWKISHDTVKEGGYHIRIMIS